MVRRFTKQDAEKAGLWTKDGTWKNYPKRMLQMRARAFACRDAIPEALKGIAVAEEVMDIAPEREVSGSHASPLETKWVDAANGAGDQEALASIWKAGVKEMNDAGDRAAYATFKRVVEVRGAEFKKAVTASVVATVEKTEEAPPVDDFVRDMENAERAA